MRPLVSGVAGPFAAVALISLLLLGTTTAGGAPRESATERVRAASPPYLTLLFSRSQWVAASNCVALPNTVSLRELAAELKRRGLRGTGTVVTEQTLETGRRCQNDLNPDGSVRRPGGTLYGSWSDIASMRRNYGWTFVSHSRNYRDLTSLSPQQQRDEACGSLEDLRAHGHFRGDGLFAYPDNDYSDVIQREVVGTCFAYGRVYDSGLNRRSQMGPPWYVRTGSVHGGNCNLSSLPCYTFDAPRRYAPPSRAGGKIAALRGDQWFVLQHYRFVTGYVAGRWDCRSADWRRHWTRAGEEYCWNDFLSLLDRIPRGTIVTDPKTVAVAWGRTGYRTEQLGG